MFEKITLALHVIAGSIALLTGLLAIVLGKKGDKTHRRIGLVFFWAMTTIFVTSWVVFIFLRFVPFLFVISVFSYYLCFAGYRVTKHKKAGTALLIDHAAAWFALVVGIFGIGMGIYIGITQPNQIILAVLSALFGYFTASSGYRDIKLFKQAEYADKMWWWYYHMQSMIGGFIAAFTAFSVQNGYKFMPDEIAWTLWILPAAVGVPLSNMWAKKYQKKFNKTA